MEIKTWTSLEKNNDKIIIFTGESIYKGNPKPALIEQFVSDFKMNRIDPAVFFCIPLRYIDAIQLQERKDYIEVRFRGDREHLRITDAAKRQEIFNYLKQHIPQATFSEVQYSKLSSAKKPLIATVVLTILFSWSLYLAIGIESGNQYDVTNQRYNSVAGIILVLASFGVKKLSIIFGFLFCITLASIIRKISNPPKFQIIALKIL